MILTSPSFKNGGLDRSLSMIVRIPSRTYKPMEHQSIEKTDNELVRAVLRGDDGAFAVLLDRHMSGVYRFAYRYLRDEDEASDITQEAFVRAWKNLKKFDASKSFKTWLFAIAKNAALDFIKKKKPLLFSRMSDDEEALDAMLSPYLGVPEFPDVAMDRTLARADLDRALDELPPAYRTVLAMRYYDHLKFREIAETLGESIDTVKSKHRRGLMLLRGLFTGGASSAGSIAG